jgi:hypothetical protein
MVSFDGVVRVRAKAKAKRRQLWWRAGALTSGLVVGVGFGCGVAIKRDLTAIPVGQIGFDDACGLQQYFDTLESKRVAPPRIVSGNELQGERAGKSVHGGHSRFAFETEFQVREVKRLLNENWHRLPAGLDKATRVDLDVYWSEVYGLRRVVTEREAQLYVGNSNEAESLPYHVCLSEFLFGEPLYRERRSTLNLAPLPSVLSPVDGGAPAPATTETGAASGAASGLAGAGGTAAAGGAGGTGSGRP